MIPIHQRVALQRDATRQRNLARIKALILQDRDASINVGHLAEIDHLCRQSGITPDELRDFELTVIGAGNA